VILPKYQSDRQVEVNPFDVIPGQNYRYILNTASRSTITKINMLYVQH